MHFAVDIFSDFKEHVKHVEKGVNSKEPHFILRVLRSLPSTRKKLNHPLLRKLIIGYFIQGIVINLVMFLFLNKPEMWLKDVCARSALNIVSCF